MTMAILHPIISEKASSKQAENQYSFLVERRTNKTEVKKMVERLYSVSVKAVRIINTPSKKRRLGKFEGSRPGAKKALVALKQGQKISTL